MTVIVSAGHSLTVSSGVTSTGIQVNDGGTLDVLFGGTADIVDVLSGGIEYLAGMQTSSTIAGDLTVQADGVASGVTMTGPAPSVSSSPPGSMLTVSSGGKAMDISFSGHGIIVVEAGGSISGANTGSGVDGDIYLSGGKASGTTVGLDGFLAINKGGVATDTTVGNVDGGAAGYVYDAGTEDGGVVYSGGLIVAVQGKVSGTVISAGGSLDLTTKSVASHVTVASGGIELVSGTAKAKDTKVDGGGYVILTGGKAKGTKAANGGQVISSGVALVSSGNAVTLFAKKTSQSVGPGATAYVLSGGVENGAAVTSGTVEVFKGGVASDTTLVHGDLYVSAGGKAVSATLSGGSEALVTGGTVTATTLASSLLYLDSGGKSYGAVLNAGAEAEVAATGLTSGAIIDGGIEAVSSGGVASNTVISGGLLDVAAGGKLKGKVTFSGMGGQLEILDPVLPATPISGFAAGDTIRLAGIAYVSGASVAVTTANQVQITDGGKIYTLNIAGALVGETDFHFSSGSLLTKGTTPAMSFMRPDQTADGQAGMWAVPRAAEVAAAAVAVAAPVSAGHFGALPVLGISGSYAALHAAALVSGGKGFG